LLLRLLFGILNYDRRQIVFYKSLSGKEVVTSQIEKLSAQDQVKVRNGLKLLNLYQLQLLQTKWVKKIYANPAIYELRIVGKFNFRLLFSIIKSRYLVTNVFIKKSQKTPKSESDLAIKRTREFT
jgi:phage-related protein